MFRFIDDGMSLNRSKLCDYVHRIYLIELQTRDTTYTIISALYIDIHLNIDSEDQLRTKPYD